MAKHNPSHVFTQAVSRRPLITALEQRILLDATAPVTAASSLGDADTDQDHSTQDAEISEVNALAPTERERKEIAFVDGGLEDVQTLIDGISDNGAHIEIVTVDPDVDGFAFMADYLEGAEGIDAIHVLGHGSQASATLGTATLDTNSIDAYASDLQQIGQSLTETGDLLLYGCYVGAGADGQALVEDIAALTSADVAASDDLTGAAALGGDWELETSFGQLNGSSFSVENFNQVLTAPSGAGDRTFTLTAGGSGISNVLAEDSDADIDVLNFSGTNDGTLTASQAGINAADQSQDFDTELGKLTLTIRFKDDNPATGVGQATAAFVPISSSETLSGTQSLKWNYTVTDIEGNTASGTFKVEVEFNTAPNAPNLGNIGTFSPGQLIDIEGEIRAAADDNEDNTSDLNLNVANFTVSDDPPKKGAFTFNATYEVTDTGGLKDSGAYSYTINFPNQSPTISSHSSNPTINEDTTSPVSLSVTASDVDTGDSIVSWTYQGVENGTLSATDPGGGFTTNFNYLPDSDFSGTETITVTAKDESNATVSHTFLVTVSGINDQPSLAYKKDTGTTDENGDTIYEDTFLPNSPAPGDPLPNGVIEYVNGIPVTAHKVSNEDQQETFSLGSVGDLFLTGHIDPDGSGPGESNQDGIAITGISFTDPNGGGTDPGGRFVLTDVNSGYRSAINDIQALGLSDSKALLIPAGYEIKYVGDDIRGVQVDIEYRAWDGDEGTPVPVDSSNSDFDPATYSFFDLTAAARGRDSSGNTGNALDFNDGNDESAFSDNKAIARITLVDVNDNPLITGSPETFNATYNSNGETSPVSILGSSATVKDVDNAEIDTSADGAKYTPTTDNNNEIYNGYSIGVYREASSASSDARRNEGLGNDSDFASRFATDQFSIAEGNHGGLQVSVNGRDVSVASTKVGTIGRDLNGTTQFDGTDGALFIQLISDGAATDARVEALLRSLRFSTAESTIGDMDIRVEMTDVAVPNAIGGTNAVVGAVTGGKTVTVESNVIHVTQTTDHTGSGIDTRSASGTHTPTDTSVSLREAVKIATDQGDGDEIIKLGATTNAANDYSVSSATVDSDNLTIPSTVTLDLESDAEITVNNGKTLTIESVISGSGNLTIKGDGTVVFKPQNTFTNNVFVEGTSTLKLDGSNASDNTIDNDALVQVAAGATLEIASDETLGPVTGAGTISIASGKTLTLQIDDADDVNGVPVFSGQITGAGNFEKTGAGAFRLANDGTETEGSNTGGTTTESDYTGSTTVTDGTLYVTGQSIGDASAVTVNGDASLIVEGSEEIGSLSASSTASTPATVDIDSGATLTLGGNDTTTTFAGVIEGEGGLTKTGAGDFTLDSYDDANTAIFNGGRGNTFTGDFTIADGKVILTGGTSIGNAAVVRMIKPTDKLTVLEVKETETIGGLASDAAGAAGETNVVQIDASQNLVIDQAGNETYYGQIAGDGGLIKRGGGTLTLDNFNEDTAADTPDNAVTADESQYKGDTVIQAGTLVATGRSIGDLSAVTVHGGATFRITGDEEIGSLASQENGNGEAVVDIDDGDGTTTPGTPTLTTGGNDEDTTFAGQIGGEGGVTKTGAGGMTLDTTGDTGSPGGNTFAGPLKVEEGEITTEGGKSIGDGTPVEVNDPGTLNVDDSEEIGSLNGDGDVNIGGDTEIGQGLTARLEGRLRPSVEDAVNPGDVIEYTLTLENTAGSDIDISEFALSLTGVPLKESGTSVTGVTTIAGTGTTTRTFTAQYQITNGDVANGSVDLDLTISPVGSDADDIDPAIVLSESTSLTPNTPNDVLTIGGNDPGVTPGYPSDDGGDFDGTTSGPGGVTVDAPGGTTVGTGGTFGHDGGTVVGDGGGLTNEGTISGEGDITVEGDADGDGTGGSFTNNGTITDGNPGGEGNGGDVNVEGPGGVFDNDGTTEGDVNNDNGTVTNGGTIGGDVNNEGEDATFTNEDGGTVNGDVDNEGGTVVNEDGGTIGGGVTTDGGTVTNAGGVNGGVTVNGGGTFDNKGTGTVGGGAEVNDGTYNNEGTTTGDVSYIPPTGNVTGDGQITGTVKPEEFVVTLHGTVDRSKGLLADTIDAGDVINYRMTVTNKTIDEVDFAEADIVLTAAEVFNPDADGNVSFTLVEDASTADNLFSEGETWVYEASVTLDAAVFNANGLAANGTNDGDGDIDQSVTVEAKDKNGNTFTGTATEATEIVRAARLTMNQTGAMIDVDDDGVASAGDRIDYTTTISNTGNVAVTVANGDFTIASPASIVDLSEPVSNFNDDNDLDAGEVWTYTHSYTLTQTDIDAGNAITGSANVSGEEKDDASADPVTASASSSVELEIPPPPETRSIIDPKTDTSETARLTMGGLIMESDGINKFDIAGTTAGETATNGGYDQVRTTAEAPRLNGAELRVNLVRPGSGKPFIPALGQSFVLMDNQSGKSVDGIFTYRKGNDEGRFTQGTDNDVALVTDAEASTRIDAEEGDILRFDGYDFRISYIGDADGDGIGNDNGLGAHNVTITRVNMYPEVLADTDDRYNDGATARVHSYPASGVIDGKDLASADRRNQSADRELTADSDGLVTIDNTVDGHATSIDLAARNTHSDFEVIAEAGQDNQGTLATNDIENLPFKVSGTLGLYDPDAGDQSGFDLVGNGSEDNGVTAVTVEHYASSDDANNDANRLKTDPRQPSEAVLRSLFTASISGAGLENVIGGLTAYDTHQAGTATIEWTFDATGEAAAAFDYLDKNEALDITYTIRVTDGQKVTWNIAREDTAQTDAYTEHAITVRVIGTNDPVKVLVDDSGNLPTVDHLWQFGRDYTDNVGRELNVYGISLEGREHATPTGDADRIFDISRLFVDRDVTEDRDNEVADGRAGLKENVFFTITSTKPSTGEVIQGPAPEDLFEKDENGAPIYGQLAAAYQGGTMEGMLPGLILDHDTGEITGRPIDIGTYIIEVTAIDSSGATATRSFELLIVAPPEIPVVAEGGRQLPQGLTAAAQIPTVERRGLPTGNVGIDSTDAAATEGRSTVGAENTASPQPEPSQAVEPVTASEPPATETNAAAPQANVNNIPDDANVSSRDNVRVTVTDAGEVRFSNGTERPDAQPLRGLQVIEATTLADRLVVRLENGVSAGNETYSVTLPDGSPVPAGVEFDAGSRELRVDRSLQGLVDRVRVTVRYENGVTESIEIELTADEELEADLVLGEEQASAEEATPESDPQEGFSGFLQQLQEEAEGSNERAATLGAALEEL